MVKRKQHIFVFGSNEAGIHGAGAAKTAFDRYGAVKGVGVGLKGNSYAIPTKDRYIRTLDVDAIRIYVNEFIQFAKDHPDMVFQVTQIGCGLAGHRPEDIANLFWEAPENCFFDFAWKKFLPVNAKYWGTF